MKYRFWIAVVLLWFSTWICSFGQKTDDFRVWTSNLGAKVEAVLEKREGDLVILRKQDGSKVQIPFALLSEEDQRFLEPPKPGKEEIKWDATLGSVVKRTAAGELEVTYHVYTPTTFDSKQPPPMIVAFSPGGNGQGILNAMKSSAEKMGWILVGCDKLKNHMKDPVEEHQMEDEVLTDIYQKVPHNSQRIYLGGMSGGAWRAYGLTARREESIAGIIAYGGWLGG